MDSRLSKSGLNPNAKQFIVKKVQLQSDKPIQTSQQNMVTPTPPQAKSSVNLPLRMPTEVQQGYPGTMQHVTTPPQPVLNNPANQSQYSIKPESAATSVMQDYTSFVQATPVHPSLPQYQQHQYTQFVPQVSPQQPTGYHIGQVMTAASGLSSQMYHTPVRCQQMQPSSIQHGMVQSNRERPAPQNYEVSSARAEIYNLVQAAPVQPSFAQSQGQQYTQFIPQVLYQQPTGYHMEQVNPMPSANNLCGHINNASVMQLSSMQHGIVQNNKELQASQNYGHQQEQAIQDPNNRVQTGCYQHLQIMPGEQRNAQTHSYNKYAYLHDSRFHVGLPAQNKLQTGQGSFAKLYKTDESVRQDTTASTLQEPTGQTMLAQHQHQQYTKPTLPKLPPPRPIANPKDQETRSLLYKALLEYQAKWNSQDKTDESVRPDTTASTVQAPTGQTMLAEHQHQQYTKPTLPKLPPPIANRKDQGAQSLQYERVQKYRALQDSQDKRVTEQKLNMEPLEDVPVDFDKIRKSDERKERKERIKPFWDLLVNDKEPKVNKESLVKLMVDLKTEGIALFKDRHYDIALLHFKNAIFIVRILKNRFSHTVVNEFTSRLFSLKAECHLKKSMFKEAVQDCESAIGEFPKNKKAFYPQAQAYKNMNKFSEAYRSACKGLEIQPSSKELQELIDELEPKITKGSRSGEQQGRQAAEVSAKSGQVLSSEDNNLGPDNDWLSGANIAVTQKQLETRSNMTKKNLEFNLKTSLDADVSNNDVNDFGRGQQGQAMQGVNENRHNFVNQQHQPLQSEKISTPILYSSTNQENVDGGQSNVDGGQLSVEVAQSSVYSSHELQRSPKDACLYDGRLINLTEDIIKNLRNENTIQIGQGSFGKVYKSLHPSKDFGMHVVVKKMPLYDGQERTIRREMITSRILHPFILPLLAAVEQPLHDGRREFWFVSPLCSKGDLHNVLKHDRMSNTGLWLNAVKRVQILLQVALAIEYIHTAVPGVRTVILHKDIACKNIVLDDNYNARLIDFGLAREEDDDTTTAGGRPYYTHPHVGNEGGRESWDYYSFGVIVRAMISKFGPEGNGTKYLKNMTSEEVTVNTYIWGHDNLENVVGKLNEMATYLLEQTDWKVHYFTKYIIQELKKIYTSLGHSCILDVSEGINDQTCHSCMINKKANQTSMIQIHNDNCNQKIEVCIACEKNSFLNPITCYCGSKLSPTIGHRWGAILVAGNDTKDPYKAEVSKALAKDVKELKKLLTSHAPRIFGISENNIRTVVPSVHEDSNVEEKLWPKVKDDIRHFSLTTNIDTLLIYFSCHGAQSSGAGGSGDFQFQLGSSEDDSITLDQFEEELERLANIEKLIIILDRCYSPLVRFKKRDRVYVQINSCKQNQKAKMDNNGSIFTRFLISGLKAKSEGKICPDTCQPCNDYWNKSKNFISVHNLFDYIKGHLREQIPICKQNLYDHGCNIAFYTGTRVKIQFSHKNSSKSIPLDYLKDMEELNEKLKKEFGQGKEVCIRRDTFRKRKKAGELENDDICDTLDKVMVAWVHRQRLEVTFNT